MEIAVVDRELYGISDPALILRMPASTLRWWLEGKAEHQPVIRPTRTGSGYISWGEFVEAGFLREYRLRGVPFQRLRHFVETLRMESGVPHPLAHAKPLVLGRGLVLEAQAAAQLDDPVIYEAQSGQFLFAHAVEQYIERIDVAPKGEPWAERIHPAGRASPVVIDPEYAFGAPSVRGIRTEALVELLDAGEPSEEIASDYGLTPEDVKAAAAYEWSVAGGWSVAA